MKSLVTLILVLGFLSCDVRAAQDGSCSSCTGSSSVYRQDVRAAADELGVELTRLAAAANQNLGPQSPLECAIDRAITLTWNFKQMATVYRTREMLRQEIAAIEEQLEVVRKTFRGSNAYGEKTVYDVFISVDVAWYQLVDVLK